MNKGITALSIIMYCAILLVSCSSKGCDSDTNTTLTQPVFGGNSSGMAASLTTCKGNCGVVSRSGCHCDSQCLKYKDCCPDYTTECTKCLDVISPVCGTDNKTYENRCKANVAGAEIQCDEECPCPRIADIGTTCKGICGKQAATGCYCDARCTTYKDCCSDYASTCI